MAAVIIQQALSGLPLPPAISNEAKSRLKSYELLTGRVGLALHEWIAGRDVPCADRPTVLSRPIADRTGRTCELGPPRDSSLLTKGAQNTSSALVAP